MPRKSFRCAVFGSFVLLAILYTLFLRPNPVDDKKITTMEDLEKLPVLDIGSEEATEEGVVPVETEGVVVE